MQAIPYKSWSPFYTTTTTISHFTQPSLNTHNINNPSVSPKSLIAKGTESMMLDMVSENPVIVFARKGCCMSHVVKRLLLGLGVNPAVYEIDEKDEGGRLFGGLDRLMATHISGELVPILKEAGALWL
ncbi:Glutaredoxin [Quillaja saponaria]|uniref:Glutaredoxin n=1 Tax=Quillaja saponaria TaxID=32244 RepID=A0AAD7PB63_QUISA|nr:Glutaredoxin [Quillaja saponaria]